MLHSEKKFKLLVAHDGSSGSSDAIDSLRYAGLPGSGEATVLSAAETGIAAASIGLNGFSYNPDEIVGNINAARACAEQRANDGAAMLRKIVPQWSVDAQWLEGSPYYTIIQFSAQKQFDLLSVGSHGSSALGRVLFGSTSQFVLQWANCSVRIGRASPGEKSQTARPARIVVAIDGSAGSDQAIETIARRSWLAGSKAYLVMAIDLATTRAISARSTHEPDRSQLNTPETVLENAASILKKSSLDVALHLQRGNPKQVVLDQAELWDCDAIFLGAQGHSRVPNMRIGSVAASVAARARCSVEVIRAFKNQPQ